MTKQKNRGRIRFKGVVEAKQPFRTALDCDQEDLMMKAVRYVAMVLLIIGALDLGVSGMGYYDPIYAVFGDALAKILYLLIGLSGVYALVRFCQKCCGGCSCCSGSKCSCCHKGRK